MTENDIIEIGKEAVREKGWSWQKPVIVRRIKKYILFGPPLWRIWTNSDAKGGNVVIYIDDATGKVLNIAMTPQ